MISSTNPTHLNSMPIGLEISDQIQTTMPQAVTSTVAPSIQLTASRTGTSSTVNADSSITQMLDTVVSMLQNLMKLLQGLLVGSSEKTPSATRTSSIVTPPEEPPTIIPVTSSTTSPETATLQPSENKVGQDGTTKTSREVESSTAPKKTRTKSVKKRRSRKSSINGQGQFLWKPKSEKDGKLAILLPKQYTGKVVSVEVMGPDGQQRLAQGKPSGVGNGDREHFRFNSPGEAFPDRSVVRVTLKDGSTREVEIKETSARFTR